MPTYASTAQLQNAIGGNAALTWITDLLNRTSDSAAVTSALEWATSLIDTYAAGTAGTTGTEGALWATTPTRAVQCCIDLAIYILYQRIRRAVPEDWKSLYTAWENQLKALSTGKVSWVVAEPSPSTNTGRVYYFGSGSTARTDNPRRTRRSQLDQL